MRFDLSEGFPAVTTKKLFLRGIIHELLWFLQGSSNIKYLVDNDVHIWDEWPYRAYLQAQGKAVPDSGSDEWKDGIKAFTERWALFLGPIIVLIVVFLRQGLWGLLSKKKETVSHGGGH